MRQKFIVQPDIDFRHSKRTFIGMLDMKRRGMLHCSQRLKKERNKNNRELHEKPIQR